jgi:hypothetical protein
MYRSMVWCLIKHKDNFAFLNYYYALYVPYHQGLITVKNKAIDGNNEQQRKVPGLHRILPLDSSTASSYKQKCL